MCVQRPHTTLKHRLFNLFHSDPHATKLILGQMALVMSVGFTGNVITGAPVQDNVAMMGQMMPPAMWALSWLAYCIVRLYATVDDSLSAFVEYSASMLGIWLWGCMLFAGMAMTVHDATVYLYTGPLQLEIWILMRNALWWTKYDASITTTVPGVLTAIPDSIVDEDTRWKQTEVA